MVDLSHERPHKKVYTALPFLASTKSPSELPLSHPHSIIQKTSRKNFSLSAKPIKNRSHQHQVDQPTNKMATLKLAKLPAQHVGNSIPMHLFFTFTPTTTAPSSSATPRVFNDLIMVNLASSTLDSINAYITERFERNVYKFKTEQGVAAKRDVYEVVGVRIVWGQGGGVMGLEEANWGVIRGRFMEMLLADEEDRGNVMTAGIEVECRLEG
ncbi:hypothetical protein LTR35_016011 [Friedmanniomyces endolithicus]|uniref:Uncharacterized protein n=1 Tax=Friedmanniomyces endolithicus TaxID=329885 RepID=A0AAN6J1Z1_9PEZI|nr:hypothetical protein LTR35_016011 [Friedmanniomyces endolithicus]KAK0273773.1 hypothetical protein LTS00_015705 [Friedmanniomyces endolithicus]KAK0308250.1 hypothetical protein LTR82_015584 [Friedmanniomyces endolithicus]KAK0976195.1 hypothetical protein LTR54_016614 [Friedmanniomyces endolithicus]